MPHDDEEFNQVMAEAKRALERAKADRAEGEQGNKSPRRITKCLPPPTYLSGTGRGWTPPTPPRPLQFPDDIPEFFPKRLEVRATAIFLEARKKFHLQTETGRMCRYIIFELTAPICAEVQDGRLRSDLGLMVMRDLRNSLLQANVHDFSERSGLEREIESSDEWSKFVRQLDAAGKDRPARTSKAAQDIEKRTESRRATRIEITRHWGMNSRTAFKDLRRVCSWLEALRDSKKADMPMQRDDGRDFEPYFPSWDEAINEVKTLLGGDSTNIPTTLKRFFNCLRTEAITKTKRRA